MAAHPGLAAVLVFMFICRASPLEDNGEAGSHDGPRAGGKNTSGYTSHVGHAVPSHVTVSIVSSTPVGSSTVRSTTTTSSTTTRTPDICSSVVCDNGGTCDQGLCVCTSLFTGDRCQTATDAVAIIQAETVIPLKATVAAIPAAIITTTTTTTTSATDRATPPTSGTTTIPISVVDQTANNNTNANGTISNTTKPTSNGDIIDIGTHFDDVTVTTITPSPCNSEPCHNGATCRDTEELFTCHCIPGYTGSVCEEVICTEDDIRSPTNGQKLCSSVPGSPDVTCELTCNPGHYFVDGQLLHLHDCSDGRWLPSVTEVVICYRVDYCANVTCRHNGTCKELWKNTTCSCLPGYTGDLCQIDVDECESSPCVNGGTCRDGSNKFICSCPENFGGFRCETAIQHVPVLTGVTPEFGPQAGGTLLTIAGDHLVVPSEYIFLYLSDKISEKDKKDKKLCKVIKSNVTHIIALTPAADDDLLRRLLPLAVQLIGGNVYQSQLYFQYKENPHITNIQPMDTIMAGGTALTISGTSLDSVAVPVIRVTMVATWRTPIAGGKVVTNKVKTVFSQPCDQPSTLNKTMRTCRMPQLDIPVEFISLLSNSSGRASRDVTKPNNGVIELHRDVIQSFQQEHKIYINLERTTADKVIHEHGLSNHGLTNQRIKNSPNKIRHRSSRHNIRRHRREQSFVNSNSTDLRFFLGFKMDGVEMYTNISAVQELETYGTLRVYTGPEIHTRDKPIQYSDLKEGQLLINGSRLLQGVRSEEYNVTIGGDRCVILDITDTMIICQAPEQQPETQPDTESEHPVITVIIGSTVKVCYGQLQYPSNIWIIVGPILGVLLVIMCILIALLVIRQRLRANHKQQKHRNKYNYSQGEMIRLPPVRREAFDDAFKTPGEGSGSLHVFRQDPMLEAFHDPEKPSLSHSGTSSMLTSADEFDGPEEFYENKETIRRQQSHEAALEQFTGNPRHSGPRYTVEPNNQRTSNTHLPNKKVPARSGFKPRAKDPEPPGQNQYPSLCSFDSASSVDNQSKSTPPIQEDVYMNNSAEPTCIVEQDIYENSQVGHINQKKKKKKKDKGFRPREPASLPPVPSTRYHVSNIPPPVPNTPRPKLNITPKHPGTNGQSTNYKHNSLSSRPFEENHYTNSRTRESDDDDIYVNSPIKSKGLRASGGRGRRGRGNPKRRYDTDRGATMWY